jgi:hypothetical protein
MVLMYTNEPVIGNYRKPNYCLRNDKYVIEDSRPKYIMGDCLTTMLPVFSSLIVIFQLFGYF